MSASEKRRAFIQRKKTFHPRCLPFELANVNMIWDSESCFLLPLVSICGQLTLGNSEDWIRNIRSVQALLIRGRYHQCQWQVSKLMLNSNFDWFEFFSIHSKFCMALKDFCCWWYCKSLYQTDWRLRGRLWFVRNLITICTSLLWYLIKRVLKLPYSLTLDWSLLITFFL